LGRAAVVPVLVDVDAMRFYFLFAMNLAVLTLQVGRVAHTGELSPFQFGSSVFALIGAAAIFPIVRRRLRGE